ncbi:hypothetical protein Clacol_009244 [Clathrus columnatus]|uniref:Mitochondrial glyco protein n=1 Tax=Clathrus columnatus TaxID=1419009 RepID=A0AAV5AP86_9AGAM|nr:hypothetical protein Clacol_009244 [Clathrus columnatus]
MSSLVTHPLRSCLKNISVRSFNKGTHRTFALLPRNALRLAVWNATAVRSFSASTAVKTGSGATDMRLSQKLQEEIKYEQQQVKDNEEQDPPEFLNAFLAEKVWKVENIPGSDEVTLTRAFGKENIKVMFTIADLDAATDDQFLNEEGEENSEEGNEDEVPPSHPIRVSITVTKAKGALSLDAVCQDGIFITENVAFYSDATLANELSAEADWKRRGLYMGPQFDHLDVSVQEEFESFLRERGISEGLALFIPEYAEYKEQKEYVGWLQNVKRFVEA